VPQLRHRARGGVGLTRRRALRARAAPPVLPPSRRGVGRHRPPRRRFSRSGSPRATPWRLGVKPGSARPRAAARLSHARVTRRHLPSAGAGLPAAATCAPVAPEPARRSAPLRPPVPERCGCGASSRSHGLASVLGPARPGQARQAPEPAPTGAGARADRRSRSARRPCGRPGRRTARLPVRRTPRRLPRLPRAPTGQRWNRGAAA
jgi:hypothetical protein